MVDAEGTKVHGNLGPDTQKHLSSTYLSAVHVTAVKTTYFMRVYTQSSD